MNSVRGCFAQGGEAARRLWGRRCARSYGGCERASDRVPDVLGDLEVAQHGAVGALLVGLAQVHVSNSTCTTALIQEFMCPYMYLCKSGRYLGPASATS